MPDSRLRQTHSYNYSTCMGLWLPAGPPKCSCASCSAVVLGGAARAAALGRAITDSQGRAASAPPGHGLAASSSAIPDSLGRAAGAPVSHRLAAFSAAAAAARARPGAVASAPKRAASPRATRAAAAMRAAACAAVRRAARASARAANPAAMGAVGDAVSGGGRDGGFGGPCRSARAGAAPAQAQALQLSARAGRRPASGTHTGPCHAVTRYSLNTQQVD